MNQIAARAWGELVWYLFESSSLIKVYFISLCFFSFLLGGGHQMTALQINIDLVLMVKAYYA